MPRHLFIPDQYLFLAELFTIAIAYLGALIIWLIYRKYRTTKILNQLKGILSLAICATIGSIVGKIIQQKLVILNTLFYTTVVLYWLVIFLGLVLFSYFCYRAIKEETKPTH